MNNLVDAFFLVVELSIMAAILAGLVFLLRWIFRSRMSAGWISALWLVVLLRLLVPVSLSSSLSIFNAIPVPSVEQMQAYTAREPAPQAAPLPTVIPSYDMASIPDTVALATTDTPVQMPDRSIDLSEILTFAWMIGTVTMLLRAIMNAANLHILFRKYTKPVVDRAVLDQLRECQEIMGIRRSVRIHQASYLKVAAVYGWIRPTILLPTDLRSSQVKHVLLHELAHIRRHDILLCYVMIALRALHWFNPMVWLAFRAIRHDREPACDAMVLRRYDRSERYAYGMTLIDMSIGVQRTCPSHMVAIFESKKQVKERVKHVSKFKSPTILSTITAILVVLILTACSIFVGNSDDSSPSLMLEAVPTDDIIVEAEPTDVANTPMPTLIPSPTTTPFHLKYDFSDNTTYDMTPSPPPVSDPQTPAPFNSSISRLSSYINRLMNDPFAELGYTPTYMALVASDGAHSLHKEYLIPLTWDQVAELIVKKTKGELKEDDPVAKVVSEKANYLLFDQGDSTRVYISPNNVDYKNKVTTAMFELLAKGMHPLPETLDQPQSSTILIHNAQQEMSFGKSYDASAYSLKELKEFYYSELDKQGYFAINPSTDDTHFLTIVARQKAANLKSWIEIRAVVDEPSVQLLITNGIMPDVEEQLTAIIDTH